MHADSVEALLWSTRSESFVYGDIGYGHAREHHLVYPGLACPVEHSVKVGLMVLLVAVYSSELVGCGRNRDLTGL